MKLHFRSLILERRERCEYTWNNLAWVFLFVIQQKPDPWARRAVKCSCVIEDHGPSVFVLHLKVWPVSLRSSQRNLNRQCQFNPYFGKDAKTAGTHCGWIHFLVWFSALKTYFIAGFLPFQNREVNGSIAHKMHFWLLTPGWTLEQCLLLGQGKARRFEQTALMGRPSQQGQLTPAKSQQGALGPTHLPSTAFGYGLCMRTTSHRGVLCWPESL